MSGTHAIVAALAAWLDREQQAAGGRGTAVRYAAQRAGRRAVFAGRARRRYDEWPSRARRRRPRGRWSPRCARRRRRRVRSTFARLRAARSLSLLAAARLRAIVNARARDALVFVETATASWSKTREPTHLGADAVMGSLIKNLGRRSRARRRLHRGSRGGASSASPRARTLPGLGAAVGPTLGFGRHCSKGFFSPRPWSANAGGAGFRRRALRGTGLAVDPLPGEPRYDIVQAIRLGTPEAMLRFARGCNSAMPVNARFAAEPGRFRVTPSRC